MSCYAIQGSGDRWFWCYWTSDSANEIPKQSGYASSKDEAIAIINDIDADATQQLAGCAKQWRGILQCNHCGSDNLQVGPGKGQHFASLKCRHCDRWLKWISEEQCSTLEQLWKEQEGAA